MARSTDPVVSTFADCPTTPGGRGAGSVLGAVMAGEGAGTAAPAEWVDPSPAVPSGDPTPAGLPRWIGGATVGGLATVRVCDCFVTPPPTNEIPATTRTITAATKA